MKQQWKYAGRVGQTYFWEATFDDEVWVHHVHARDFWVRAATTGTASTSTTDGGRQGARPGA